VNNLQGQNLTVIGVILPTVWVGALVVLILLSFMSSQISSVIAAESLILLTVILLPVVCAVGVLISISVLTKSEDKRKPLLAAGLNIAILVFWLFFSKSFLMELELIS